MSEQRTTAAGGMETSYGYKHVGSGEKQSLVNDVFHRVANRYDLMNDLMSGGLHRLWKEALVAWLNPPRRSGWRVLDVAGGTGDVASRIVDASRREAQATVLDINASMLAVGRERAAKQGLEANIDFVEANAEQLPFADETFDAYTIAFGIRNVPRIETALQEAFRVLKPGGRFLCLEFSEVDMPFLDRRVRGLVVQCHTAHRKVRGRRRRAVFISGGVDSQVPQSGEFCCDDPPRRFRPRHFPQLFRWHCRAAFGLETLRVLAG